jgi:hypothetical protein
MPEVAHARELARRLEEGLEERSGFHVRRYMTRMLLHPLSSPNRRILEIFARSWFFYSVTIRCTKCRLVVIELLLGRDCWL